MMDEDGLKLSEDIFDCGVIAFLLLDGINKEEDEKHQSNLDVVSMSARTEKAFASESWSKVSPICK